MVGPFFVKIQNSEFALFFGFLRKLEPNTKVLGPRIIFKGLDLY